MTERERGEVRIADLLGALEWRPAKPEEAEAMMTPWIEYTNALQEAGAMLGGEALKGIETVSGLCTRDPGLVAETACPSGPRHRSPDDDRSRNEKGFDHDVES
ncbi:MAG: hypothetical protein L0Z63_06910 [Actinobacteria bacterium]|nr:hypothetical protein [Actinomycetota bacterium]